MISKLRLCAVWGLLAGLAMAEAHATSTPAPSPPPAPAMANAGASAGSTSGASAAARQRQQQQQAQSAEANNSNSLGGDSSRLYVLPSPVFTPPMAAVACPGGVDITNEAVSLGWNAVSAARGHTDNSACVLITLRNAYVEQCQYASAKQVQDLLTAKHLPAFKSSSTVYLDLTHQECAAFKAPPVTVRTEYVTIGPAPVVELPKVKPQPKKRHRAVLVPKCAAVEKSCRT